MIKITNEINGKKYELVPRTFGCFGCVFDRRQADSFSGCKLNAEHAYFQGRPICEELHGIWKEARDEAS